MPFSISVSLFSEKIYSFFAFEIAWLTAGANPRFSLFSIMRTSYSNFVFLMYSTLPSPDALSTMITDGESQIEKVVCIGSKGNIMLPCGVCREFMMQLNSNNKSAEILLNYEKLDIVTLSDLLPNWWN